jgi:hypothetical protein
MKTLTTQSGSGDRLWDVQVYDCAHKKGTVPPDHRCGVTVKAKCLYIPIQPTSGRRSPTTPWADALWRTSQLSAPLRPDPHSGVRTDMIMMGQRIFCDS